MTDLGKAFAPWAIPALMAASTLSGTVVIACMMPFAAIATLAALALPARRGAATIALCWLANQALGFGLLGFPWDAVTLAAGGALLGASLVAFATVRALGRRGGPVLAFLAGFAAFEASLFAYALVFGDPAMFAPSIVALVAVNDLAWFTVLWLGWQVLVRVPVLAPHTR